jgi:hypothetical protein
MREVSVPGLRVTLGEPRPVLEAVGHLWFPTIDRFPTGEFLLTAIRTADTHDNLVNAYAVLTSADGGATWSAPFDVAGWSGGPRIPQSDGSLAGPEFYLYADPPGQAHRFRGHLERFEAGGRRFAREPYAVQAEGFPRDLRIHGEGKPWRDRWPASFDWYGNFVDRGDEILTTAYLRFAGEERYSVVALASTDRGRTWRYRSTVAGSETAPDGQEGPNESNLVQLADGDLMCVMRVGRALDAGPTRAYGRLARAYSADGGRTWSTPDRLSAAGVAPCLRRLSNGVLALTTGRPGLFLWLSDDPRGRSWQSIDLLAHHNAALDERHRIRPGQGGFHEDPDQTTAYTGLVEVAPNRLLLTYDRVPLGWKGVPTDSEERNRIYVMEIEIA